jgi:tetratricopeptide (TPR) repeat protein
MHALDKSLLDQLNQALTDRRIGDGLTLLEVHCEAISTVSPNHALAAPLALCLAQWVDVGFAQPEIFHALVARFTEDNRRNMRMQDYLQLRMAEAYARLSEEDASSATDLLDFVLRAQQELAEDRLVTLAHFWKGRAHRKKGEYAPALHHILAARALAQKMNAPKIVAVIKIHESWLLFQKDERREALRLLDEAEVEIGPTDHALSRGNIESARGRFVRRSGEYAKALAHFDRAIAIYSERHAQHPNLARALTNAAYVKRLIALDLRKRLHAGRARGAQHARYLQICQEALALLRQAGEIYSMHRHQGGTGSVLVNAGHLHLDSGDIDSATEEAVKAFSLGKERGDRILMARARILQAACANARVDEQLGDDTDAAVHANFALEYAEEAIALAQQTQNKRLLTGAYIARGATAANDFFQEWDVAKKFVSLASEQMSKDDRDHLSKDLATLKARILRASGIDETLRGWSEGILGSKTFQQVTEEFAEIVIPKVWAREGRKISRVASKLSISPKKVRRILRNAELLERR